MSLYTIPIFLFAIHGSISKIQAYLTVKYYFFCQFDFFCCIFANGKSEANLSSEKPEADVSDFLLYL